MTTAAAAVGEADGPDAIAVVAAKVTAPSARGLARDRVDALLGHVWRHKLGVVVAPAGYGKTTALAGFAAAAGVPVAWYRADAWDGDEDRLLRHLQRALAPVLGASAPRWRSAADVAHALERRDGEPVLLVVDDLHTIEGTAAEQCLGLIVDYAPPGLAVAVASRTVPRLNLSRLRLEGSLLEVGADDLRFRAWEVERLFRDVYAHRVTPQELAELARLTDGWAAGLQLFHLATSGRTADERRRVLGGLAGSRLVREYLTRNVLDHLPTELRTFLVDTSVLGRLTGPLCDHLRGRTDSRTMLAELERRRLFTQSLDSVDGDAVYAYHEVLRSHLEAVLLEERGDAAVRSAFLRAGDLLAASGAHSDALRAYCRAEDWVAVAGLLGGNGERLVARPGRWVDSLPAALVANDPWLLLASARRHRAEGRWQAANETYRRAEAAFRGSRGEDLCRADRLALGVWLTPAVARARPDHWSGLLRAAVRRDPSAVIPECERLGGAMGRLVEAVAELLRGRLDVARGTALATLQEDDAGAEAAAAALTVAAVAALLGGDDAGSEQLARAAEEAERAGAGWLGRLIRAARALTPAPAGVADAAEVGSICVRDGDPWGAALAALLEGWGGVRRGEAPQSVLDAAAARLRELDAASVAVWAAALAALAGARAGTTGARDAALQADAASRQHRVAAAAIPALAALVVTDLERADHHRSVGLALAAEAGLVPPAELLVTSRIQPAPSAPARPSTELVGRALAGGGTPILDVRCFGGLHVTVDGAAVDLSAVKPRVRTLLRLLAVAGGGPVHRELIADALWPEVTLDVALRNLHVAVSSLRGLLEPGRARGAWQLVVRDGDVYRLVVPVGGTSDVARFHAALARARAARQAGELDAADAAAHDALELCAAELLPEEVHASWADERREMFRSRVLDTTATTAATLAQAARLQAAADLCTAGLRIEPTHDALWRLLIDVADRRGDAGVAARARLQYAAVLADLGVGAPGTAGPGLQTKRAAFSLR